MDSALCLLHSWYSISSSGGSADFFITSSFIVKIEAIWKNLVCASTHLSAWITHLLTLCFPSCSEEWNFPPIWQQFSPVVQYIHLSPLLYATSLAILPSPLLSSLTAFSLTAGIILISIETYYNLFQPPPYFSVFYSKISQVSSIFPPVRPVFFFF